MSGEGAEGAGAGPRRGAAGPPLLPTSGWTAPLVGFSTAAMAFLAVLTLAAALAAGAVAAEWRADLAGVATVRLAPGGDDAPGRLAAVMEVLRTTPGIARVRALDADELRALVAPWLGRTTDLDALPMPQLIDVTLTGQGPDAAALQRRLDLTVAGALYDDHAAWRAPMLRAAGTLERLTLAATALILATVAAIVAFAARATLQANRHVVVTLRLVGAEDGFIARAFVGRLVWRAALGGALGAALGCLAVLAMPRLEGADPVFALSAGPGPGGWALLALAVPLLAVAVTWAAARGAVSLTLKGMP